MIDIMRWARLAPGKELRIARPSEYELEQAGFYPSTGLPKRQLADWRLALRDGSGIHVLIYEHHAIIHRDRVDPSVSFWGHMVQDAPGVLFGGLATLGALAGILAASSG